MFYIDTLIFIFATCLVLINGQEDVCYKTSDNCQNIRESTKRYLFYDINPSEGFNLRRDVYMRMAILVNKLKNSPNQMLNSFILVLPPWSHLIHWGYSESPEYIPWSTFFDIESLRKFAPVMDLYEYFTELKHNKYTKLLIHTVYILQHFEDMFKSGRFEDKWNIEKCQRPPKLRFFHYANITSKNIQCLSFHGPSTKLIEIFKQDESRTIMIEYAEVALHDTFGGSVYWKARRSMRFNVKLRQIAKEFRREFLNSTDSNDNTHLPIDWRDEKPKRSAKGGPYLAIHLRRQDFLRGRPDQVPDLKSVADQISKKLVELNLTKVFIATDAPLSEYNELQKFLNPNHETFKYVPSIEVENEFFSGGIAIIDQIICSYARYFMGTAESTFSFRIQEEREILGFPTKTTFNVLCKDENHCEKPSIWKIVY
ncbi:hypothetical protein ABEB36_002104 [Hypothenemus hampei]|uniref:GDP-fucose protein O-fucosyltransferase 2 n=1 Tax=Hypothenemus hampei TaxID=57062 RepID=A0ABD1F4M7_HYPHA